MDIIGRIDHTIEDWERRPDAMRWTPDGEQGERKGPTLNVAHGEAQAFIAPLGTSAEDLNGWSPIGTVDPGPTISTALTIPQFEAITHDDNGEPFTITLSDPLPAPEWLHLATCAYCDRTSGETAARVFTDQVVRRLWVDAHQEETGHAIWSLVSVRRDAISVNI